MKRRRPARGGRTAAFTIAHPSADHVRRIRCTNRAAPLQMRMCRRSCLEGLTIAF